MKLFAGFAALVVVNNICAASELPKDVQSFIDKREGCEHFRGEPWDPGEESVIKERREFIFKNIDKLCTGTDRRLAHLRRKYHNNPKVIDRLRVYEDQVEVPKAAR